MSSAPKYQIFISSTYTDLILEREAVMKAILTNYHIPIGMEMFSAGDDEQWETIKETIDFSDYYVLIIGQRYGSQTEGISYTQKEFEYALERKIPILAFVRDRNYPTSPSERDDDSESMQKLNSFITTVTTGRMVEWFKNTDELALKVTSAIFKAIARHPRPGWIRSTEVPNLQEVLDQMTLLQKENRELASQLRSQSQQRVPEFEILINESDNIKLETSSKNWPMTAFIKADNVFDPGHFHTHQEYARLIKFHQIKATKYNEIKLRYLVCNSYKRMVLKVGNIGNTKAVDVNLILTFPEEINLLVGSTERFPKFSPSDEIDMIEHLSPFIPKSDKSISELKRGMPGVDMPRFYDIQSSGNQVFINIPSILHTKNIEINKIYISGRDFSIETKLGISVVCEEIPEPLHFEIPISVEYDYDPSVIEIDSVH